MKNKIVLLFLTINAELFCVQQAQPQSRPTYPQPVQQQNKPLSLKEICFKEIAKGFDAAKDSQEKINYNALVNNVCNKSLTYEFESYREEQKIIHEAALLWVTCHRDYIPPRSENCFKSPLELLEEKKTDLFKKIKDNKITWKLSLQNIINAGGAKNLSDRNGNLSKLCLTSLDGLQNIPDIYQVKSLDLSENEIQIIPENIFNKFTQLKELRLYYNNIKTISHNTFDHNTQIEKLYLNNNELTVLPENIFTNNTQLKELSLCSNIQTIPEKTFKPLERLKMFSLMYSEINPDQRKMIKNQVPKKCRLLF